MADANTCTAEIVINPEVRALIPPLAPDERELLEAAIVRDGCRDALVVWQETVILLDGHVRFEICTRLGLAFTVVAKSFPTRDEALLFAVENQLGRRNLPVIDRIALAARREPLIRARAARNQGARTDLPQNSAEGPVRVETREAAAEAAGVSHDTYAKGIAIIRRGTPELVQAVRNGDASIHAAAEIASLPAAEQVAAVAAGNLTQQAKALRSHRTRGSGDDQWDTPPSFLDAAHEVLGGIDLDPASNVRAQNRVKAAKFFTIEDDGLAQPWSGRVWLNPPFSRNLIARFVNKLVDEFLAGRVTAAILLVNNETDVGWFHTAAAHASRLCLLRGRISFLRLDGSRSKNGALQGQVILYFGDGVDSFDRVFGELGLVLAPPSAVDIIHEDARSVLVVDAQLLSKPPRSDDGVLP